MKQLHWVVQQNLGQSETPRAILDACNRLGLQCTLIDRTPFSKALPNLPTEVPTVFYGSTSFVHACFAAKRWRPAAFFDAVRFAVSHWGPRYGHHWINDGAFETTLHEFIWKPYQDDRLFFVRPSRDVKAFTGGVWSMAELRRWRSGLRGADLDDKDLAQIPIVVAEPWGLRREWRLFMVAGRVSSGSQYKDRFELAIDRTVPQEVTAFGERMAAMFSPHKIFVLDVCESADSLYVLEIGCVNTAGFYAADRFAIIRDITAIGDL